jgi:protein O-mannosyl-transferase
LRVLELEFEDAESPNNLGAVYAEKGDFEDAVTHFAEAVRLRPGYAEAERNLEMARRVLDVFDEP